MFIEGVAFFLLRQYRAIIEDYKAFYRVSLRASNLLASLHLLDGAPEDRRLAAGALLHEEPSFKWTQALPEEPAGNPFTELIRGLLPPLGKAVPKAKGKTNPKKES